MRLTRILAVTLGLCQFAYTGAALASHLFSGVQGTQSGAIKTLSPQTLPQGKWLAGLAFEYLKPDHFSDAELEAIAASGEEGVHSIDGSIQTLNLSLAYGISDDFTVYLQLPYITRDTVREGHFDEEEGEAEVEVLGESKGVGDLAVLGQYRFFRPKKSRLRCWPVSNCPPA